MLKKSLLFWLLLLVPFLSVVSGGADPDIALTEMIINPEQPVAGDEISILVFAENIGTEPANVGSNIVVYNEDFLLAEIESCCQYLEPGESGHFLLTFSPSYSGEYFVLSTVYSDIDELTLQNNEMFEIVTVGQQGERLYSSYTGEMLTRDAAVNSY